MSLLVVPSIVVVSVHEPPGNTDVEWYENRPQVSGPLPVP